MQFNQISFQRFAVCALASFNSLISHFDLELAANLQIRSLVL